MEQLTPTQEALAAREDATIFGAGFLVDGKRVHPKSVMVIHSPHAAGGAQPRIEQLMEMAYLLKLVPRGEPVNGAFITALEAQYRAAMAVRNMPKADCDYCGGNGWTEEGDHEIGSAVMDCHVCYPPAPPPTARDFLVRAKFSDDIEVYLDVYGVHDLGNKLGLDVMMPDYWMGRDEKYPLAMSTVIDHNASILVSVVNGWILSAQARGAVFEKRNGTIVSSGWRPAAVNASTPGAAKNSKHMIGQAVDLFGPDNKLATFAFNNQDLLKEHGLWMEHPSATPTWIHLQTVPPRSGNRVFYP